LTALSTVLAFVLLVCGTFALAMTSDPCETSACEASAMSAAMANAIGQLAVAVGVAFVAVARRLNFRRPETLLIAPAMSLAVVLVSGAMAP
jgi:hypothetical protein